MCSLYVEFTALAASVMLEVINTADRHIVCVCVCERERERESERERERERERLCKYYSMFGKCFVFHSF